MLCGETVDLGLTGFLIRPPQRVLDQITTIRLSGNIEPPPSFADDHKDQPPGGAAGGTASGSGGGGGIAGGSGATTNVPNLRCGGMARVDDDGTFYLPLRMPASTFSNPGEYVVAAEVTLIDRWGRAWHPRDRNIRFMVVARH